MSRRQYWLLVAGVVLAATALNWPTMHVGYTLDDYAQVAMLEGRYPVDRAPWDLYTFSDGTRDDVARLVETGFYPWWSHPEVRLSMFRPLASLLLALDLSLLGHNPFAQHLHSLGYWLAMLFAVAWLFERTLPRPVALTAILLFALDQAHPISLGWIANRTSLISTAFSALALVFYLDFQQTARKRAAWSACACYTVALLGGEYGLSFMGFFVAYEWLGCGGQPRVKLARLAWVGLPALGFVVARGLVHAGARHSEVYLDPAGSTGLFAQALLQRLPVLIADSFLSLRSDYWSFGAPWVFPAFEAGFVDQSWLLSFEPWRRVHVAIGWVACLVLSGVILFFARRCARVRACNAVWLISGGLLSTLPLPGSLPTSRLVLIPTVGMAALLAALLHERLAHLRTPGLPLRARLPAVAMSGAIVWLHVCLAPIQVRAEGRLLTMVATRMRQAVLEAPFDPIDGPHQHAIVLATGDPTLMIYIGLVRTLHGRPAPRSTWVLSGNRFPYRLSRPDPRTLVLRYMPGTSLLVEPFELMFRSREAPLHPGDRFELSAMTTEVLSVTREGRPTATRFTFNQPLEHRSLSFWIPTATGLRPFAPPAVGQTIDLPPAAVPLGPR